MRFRLPTFRLVLAAAFTGIVACSPAPAPPGKKPEAASAAAAAPAAPAVDAKRAKIDVATIEIKHDLGSKPVITVYIKNTGTTAASDVAWRANFAVAPPEVMDSSVIEHDKEVPKTPLPAGQTLSFVHDFPSWDPRLDEKLQKHEIAFVAIGEILYKDADGKDHVTNYKWVSGGRFGRKDVEPLKWAPAADGNSGD